MQSLISIFKRTTFFHPAMFINLLQIDTSSYNKEESEWFCQRTQEPKVPILDGYSESISRTITSFEALQSSLTVHRRKQAGCSVLFLTQELSNTCSMICSVDMAAQQFKFHFDMLSKKHSRCFPVTGSPVSGWGPVMWYKLQCSMRSTQPLHCHSFEISFFLLRQSQLH